MATYRAYFLDSEKHIYDRKDFEAESDEKALKIAKQWENGSLIEVWQEGTFVGVQLPRR